MDEQPPKKSVLRWAIGRIGMLLAAILLAGAVWLLLPDPSAPPMPVYQGKTAKEWLYSVRPANPATRTQFVEAFRQMGSNAVPFLVHELKRKDSAWGEFCQWAYPKLPTGITRHLPPHEKQLVRWNNASFGLTSTRSKAAIPPLLDMLSKEDTTRQAEALTALQFIAEPKDTNCVPPLTTCFQSKEPVICVLSAKVLEKINPSSVTIPPLTNCVNSTNAFVRIQSIGLLMRHDASNWDKWHSMLTNEPVWECPYPQTNRNAKKLPHN